MADSYQLILFTLVVSVLLILDLTLLNRKPHAITIKQAGLMCGFWVTLSLLFGAYVWWSRGAQSGLEFFTGYVVEYALSVDNLFVFIMLFTFFQVPREYQYRILFWGILGAIVMRGIMIAIGGALVSQFAWILYFFGAFLVFTGIKMLLHKEEDNPDLNQNPVLRLCRRVLPLTNELHGQRFTAIVDGKRVFTPLAVVLIMVEFTDLVFAVDSIPAIFAITQDTYIVFTSNVCAILGLRSLFFVLAGMMNSFAYLKIGLSAVLVFIGCKMLIAQLYHVPIHLSLLVVITLLGGSVLASLLFPPKTKSGD